MDLCGFCEVQHLDYNYGRYDCYSFCFSVFSLIQRMVEILQNLALDEVNAYSGLNARTALQVKCILPTQCIAAVACVRSWWSAAYLEAGQGGDFHAVGFSEPKGSSREKWVVRLSEADE